MKFVFTKHATFDKFAILKKHKFKTPVTKRLIKEIILNPEHADEESDKPNIIASKSIDVNHILRVVYRKEFDIIRVITFYPAEKGRYYEEKAN